MPLVCEAIYLAMDEEHGLVISLSERRAGEGLAIHSMPGWAVSTGHEVGKTERSSSLSVRARGANLFM